MRRQLNFLMLFCGGWLIQDFFSLNIWLKSSEGLKLLHFVKRMYKTCDFFSVCTITKTMTFSCFTCTKHAIASIYCKQCNHTFRQKYTDPPSLNFTRNESHQHNSDRTIFKTFSCFIGSLGFFTLIFAQCYVSLTLFSWEHSFVAAVKEAPAPSCNWTVDSDVDAVHLHQVTLSQSREICWRFARFSIFWRWPAGHYLPYTSKEGKWNCLAANLQKFWLAL